MKAQETRTLMAKILFVVFGAAVFLAGLGLGDVVGYVSGPSVTGQEYARAVYDGCMDTFYEFSPYSNLSDVVNACLAMAGRSARDNWQTIPSKYWDWNEAQKLAQAQ